MWVQRRAGTAACTSVAVAWAQVVKDADEAANAYQIFIRPGESAQLVKKDEIGSRSSHFVQLLVAFARMLALNFFTPSSLHAHLFNVA